MLAEEVGVAINLSGSLFVAGLCALHFPWIAWSPRGTARAKGLIAGWALEEISEFNLQTLPLWPVERCLFFGGDDDTNKAGALVKSASFCNTYSHQPCLASQVAGFG